jgi:hypothetical protein
MGQQASVSSAIMSHAAMLLIALSTFAFGILVWRSVFAVSVQRQMQYTKTGGTSSNVKNISCTGHIMNLSALHLLIYSKRYRQEVIHKDTVIKIMNLYSHNTIPFLLPCPYMFINVRSMNGGRDQLLIN